MIVIPSLVKTGVFEVVKGIIKNNNGSVEFYLVSLREREADESEFIKSILGQDHLFILPGSKLFSIKKILTLNKVINSISPDIIHFHSFVADVFSLWVKSKKKPVLISTAHNMGKEDFVPMFGKVTGTLMAIVQLFIYKKLDYLVGVSRTVTNHYKNLHINNAVTILNGTEIDLTAPQEKCLSGLVQPIGIYCGNFEKRKNVEFLFDAFSEIKLPDSAPSLIVLGSDRTDSSVLETYKKRYGNTSIQFFGRVDNVVPFLKKADYFISPSKSEGLPMAAIEAMGCNLPLILSNIPQHREMKLERDEDICFFDPTNPDSLKNTLISFIKNWNPRHISSNKKVYNNYFTSKQMANGYIKLYLGCLSKDNYSDI